MTKSLAPSPPFCCLCGLLCPTAMQWPASGGAHRCARLHEWLITQDAFGASNQRDVESADYAVALAEQAKRLSSAARPLIWIESADVAATRAAVRLAVASQATIHVAQSPGAHNVSAITASHGFVGTTLAEVGRTADLIVHLGQQHLHEMPLLTERFLNTADMLGDAHPNAEAASAANSATRRHIFIGEQPQPPSFADAAADDRKAPAVTQLLWPRGSWLEQFTRVLLAMRTDWASLPQADNEADVTASELAKYLLASRYVVIMWSENELADELDKLLVARLLELARRINQSTRCSLLPLSVDPGRVTAKEALLWLTNRASTTNYRDGQWHDGASSTEKSLQDWQSEHDWIICLRTLPSDRPLPDIRFDLLLDARCNQLAQVQTDFEHQSHGSTNGSSDQEPRGPAIIQIATVGLECSGQLTRVDHGFSAYVPAVEASFELSANKPSTATALASQSERNLPLQSASVVLEALTSAYRSASTAD